LLAAAVAVSLVLSVAFASPSDAKVAVKTTQLPPGGCAGMSGPEENHASIRLRVDQPASGAQAAVDEHGKINIGGIVHKHATMVDVLDDPVTSSDFVLGPPPDGVAAWAVSWTTSMRPPHLGANTLCARAVRDPKRFARIQRSFTVVDLIPPSAVPGLAVSNITATGAKVSWGAATDNYGLAGYEVTVDGGTAVRTTIGTRSYAVTGLSPSTHHTVSVVAVDLAGNRSTTPATVSFTTAAAPPPPNPDTDLVIDPQEGFAAVSWHPNPAGDVTYQAYLDGQRIEDFPLDLYCQDANGNPASPCTARDVISYPISDLDEGTPYTIQIKALRADGTQSRELSGTFTTLTTPRVVPEATAALIASESSRCVGMGGSFYVSPSARGRVSIPAGSTRKFDGCYRVVNSSCIGSSPVAGNKVFKCGDDITHLLYSVAPPGRGPVISSMEAVTPAFVPSPVIEPIRWCAEEPVECVEVIETAAEAGAVVAEAVGAAAVASFLIVAAEGIGLGLVLGVLLAILFPTELTIGSMFEYTQITPDTDFDTFTEWGGDHGEWYNSLKVYAEVVKTTKQVTAAQNLPFAWDKFKSQDLKGLIDSVCAVQQGHTAPPARGCGDNLVVYVPGGKSFKGRPMPQTGQHIVDAMTTGRAQDPRRDLWYYPAYSRGGALASGPPNNYPRNWFTLQRFRPNNCDSHVPGDRLVCDEFPFFTTNQAVDLTLPDKSLVADVKLVPGDRTDPQRNEGAAQGSDLAAFYENCLGGASGDGKRFIVLPVPSWVAAGGPSFGFHVNQGGASLCLPPTPPGP
jgi:chitodextrinase